MKNVTGILLFLGLASAAFGQFTGPKGLGVHSLDAIIGNPDGECKYTEEGTVVGLLDERAPTEKAAQYCLRSGVCELNDSRLPYVFTCLTEDGACPEDPKECYLRASRDSNPVSTLAVLSSPEEDEQPKDFKACKYDEKTPRTVFYKVGKDLSQYFAICLASVACEGQDAPIAVACAGESVVQTSEGPVLKCPGVGKCVNGRFRTGENYPK